MEQVLFLLIPIAVLIVPVILSIEAQGSSDREYAELCGFEYDSHYHDEMG